MQFKRMTSVGGGLAKHVLNLGHGRRWNHRVEFAEMHQEPGLRALMQLIAGPATVIGNRSQPHPRCGECGHRPAPTKSHHTTRQALPDLMMSGIDITQRGIEPQLIDQSDAAVHRVGVVAHLDTGFDPIKERGRHR